MNPSPCPDRVPLWPWSGILQSQARRVSFQDPHPHGVCSTVWADIGCPQTAHFGVARSTGFGGVMGYRRPIEMKLVGMSRGWAESFRDLGFHGLGGVSGRVDVVVAGVVDGVILGTTGMRHSAGCRGHARRKPRSPRSARWVGWQIN